MALHTLLSLRTIMPWRSLRTYCSCRTWLSSETLSTLVTLGSPRPWCTYHTNVAFGSFRANLTWESPCTLWTMWANRT